MEDDDDRGGGHVLGVYLAVTSERRGRRGGGEWEQEVEGGGGEVGGGREREGGVSTCSTVKDTGRRPVVQCAEEPEATMCRRLYNLCNIKVHCTPYKRALSL